MIFYEIVQNFTYCVQERLVDSICVRRFSDHTFNLLVSQETRLLCNQDAQSKLNNHFCREEVNFMNMNTNNLQHCSLSVRLCGVMDITFAAHAEGPELDPDQSLSIFSINRRTIL